MAKKKMIMIADDEIGIHESLRIYLTREGYEVFSVFRGDEVMSAFERMRPDLVILDIMMPGMDGVEVCARIRARSPVPILFLTAKSQDTDKVDAYTSGGDDYLVKPFSQTELLMKIKSLLRRHNEYDKPAKKDDHTEVLSEDITVDVRTRSVRRKDLRINLTDKEFDILRYFMDHRGEVVQNKDLYENVWGDAYLPSASNTIMVHILNLRKKLETDVSKPRIIRTVWGKGYKID